MQVFRGIPNRDGSPIVLTIGNFDGLHRGHCHLLNCLNRYKQDYDLVHASTAVMTFDPLPAEFFLRQKAPLRLISLKERIRALAKKHIDEVYICQFNQQFSAISAEDFVVDYLYKRLNCKLLLIGDDFKFGANRQGDFSLLQSLAKEHTFRIIKMPTFEDAEGYRISSSQIRQHLFEGKLQSAHQLLGREYSICGRVIHGNGKGKQFGFPTINVFSHRPNFPLNGVFVVKVMGLSEQAIAGVANIGVRPTLYAGGFPQLEVHLFNWRKSCYGSQVEVVFLHKLRDEKKFSSIEQLIQQIRQDSIDAQQYLHLHTH